MDATRPTNCARILATKLRNPAPVALAISVAVRCDLCIAYHAEGAVKQGASRAEVAETLAMAVYMGAGPSMTYAPKALEAVDQIAAPDKPNP